MENNNSNNQDDWLNIEGEKRKTINNRDLLMTKLRKLDPLTIVEYLIETMMLYSQDEDVLTGQYMMVLDAARKVLIEMGFIPDNIDCWTLEEFLNGISFHSHFYPNGDRKINK
jgi:hypothetical protein